MNGSRLAGRWIVIPLSLAAILGSTLSCNRKKPTPPPPPIARPAPTPIEELVVTPPEPPPAAREPVAEEPPAAFPPRSLLEGETSYETGDFPGAIGAFEVFLKEHPGHHEAARISFQLAIAYALSPPTEKSKRQATDQFRRVVQSYPESVYRREAEFILRLNADLDKLRSEGQAKDEKIKRLTEELERIKKIDLERRPPRPPAASK